MSTTPEKIKQIILLLRKLKKDSNWLIQYILENNLARNIQPTVPAGQALEKASDELLAKLLSELKGIERNYETNGYPKGFDSILTPEVVDIASMPTLNYGIDDSVLEKLGLSNIESQILLYLLSHQNSTASDISRNTGRQRIETYNFLSTLLARGVVFSTSDRPQKYYTPHIHEVLDRLARSVSDK